MIDWQRICLNLRTHYKPLTVVAAEIGASWKHIERLSLGETQQPRFNTGVKLLDLHHDKCPGLHRREVIGTYD